VAVAAALVDILGQVAEAVALLLLLPVRVALGAVVQD
jgi:hypothetical protein